MMPLTSSGLYPVVKSLGPFVPTSPITLVTPVLVLTPFDENKAKHPELFKLGAIGPLNVVLPQPEGIYANNSVTVIAP